MLAKGIGWTAPFPGMEANGRSLLRFSARQIKIPGYINFFRCLSASE
jgi:hypothetical protein